MRMRSTVIVGSALVIILSLLLILSYFFSRGKCSEGMFTCKSEVCVPQRSVCNGHVDCPDGEDENAATCGDYFGSQYIMNLTKNSTFDAFDHQCGHGGLADGCFCRRKYWVYCKQLNLTVIPKDIEGTVQRLILANNSIKAVWKDDLTRYSESLQLLHLEGNGIAHLPDNLFTAQIHLQKLILIKNEIQEINEHVFNGLRNLSMIYLQHNRISHLHLRAFSTLTALRYLDLSDNLLSTFVNFPRVPHLLELFLDRNRLSALNGSEFFLTGSLHCLGLSGNGLKSVEKRTFTALEDLRELDLSRNELSDLHPDLWARNPNLHKLNLSYNQLITSISKDWFSNISHLYSLSLEGIEIRNLNKDLFSGLHSLEFIYFSKYFFCTFVPEVKYCSPKTDGMSTMDSMIGRPTLRSLLWFVAIPILLGNALVISGRQATKDGSRSHNDIVTSLSDLCMGIYLVIIGVKDWEYDGIYRGHSHAWLSSWLCSVAGALAMLSSEVSLLVLTFMSIDRFFMIAVPFSRFQSLSRKTSRWCITFIWITGVAIACFPWILYQRNSTGFYGTNAMCFPLHLDDPYFAGWQYSAMIFLVLNFIELAIVTVMYMGMFISILRTRNCTSRGDCSADRDIALRFFFIVLTNAACWLPIVVLKILAFFRIFYISSKSMAAQCGMGQVVGETYGWIAVVVVPINSAFNPLIYTLTTPKYTDRIREYVMSWISTRHLTNIFPSCQPINMNLEPSSRQLSGPSNSVEEYSLNSVSVLSSHLPR